MTNHFLKISLSLLFAALLTSPASATDLSDAKKGGISQNCNAIKTSLSSVQKADSKTRVLLGTSYQTILTNFIPPLNIRMIKANLSDSSLSTAQANIASERDNFGELFIGYSKSLEDLLNTDCKSNPEEFYEKLESTRSARKALNKSATRINSLITSSITTVTNLRNSLETKESEKESKDGSL